MKSFGNLLVSSSSLLLLAGAAAAGTLRVPKDFATIQAAVDVALPGDVVAVSAGVYRENVTVTTSGITLQGRNATIDGAYLGTCLDVQADDVTIIGLEFVNGGIAATPELVGAGGGLSYVGDSASIVMCEASGCVGFGISLVGHGAIEDCLIAACLGAGLVVDTDDQSGEQVTLEGNEIVHCGSGIQADDGPFLFARNTVSHNAGDGIHLTILAAAGEGKPTTSTEFTRNKCVGNGGTGLLVLDEVGAVALIEDNDFNVNNVGLDLTGADVTVTGNDFDLNRAEGVFLKTTGALMVANRVRRNSFCGVAVSSFGAALDGLNTLTGNKVDANGGDGIHVESGHNVIDHNYTKDNKGDGMQVVAGAFANTLVNNIATANQHDGIDNWGTGTVIRDNTSKFNFGADLAGIGDGGGTVDATSSGNTVTDGSGLLAEQELELATIKP